MITTAFLNIWNKSAGAIAWDDSTGIGSFEFEPSFLSYNWDISPLKIPSAGGKGRIFSFSALRDSHAFKGLPGMLADVMKGFTQWLIKFDGVSDSQFGATSGYGRVEMAYHLMAKDAGIETLNAHRSPLISHLSSLRPF
jgi:serine/threonine-protein kinase HipA